MQSCKYMSECLWPDGSGRVELKVVPSLPPSCVSSVSVKENPDAKKKLNFANVSISYAKKSTFLLKNCTFTQSNIMRVMLEIF